MNRVNWLHGLRQPGVPATLGAALLFGGGTLLAKWLLISMDPWLLAGLLYLGSGTGLLAYRLARRVSWARLPRNEWPWLAGAVAAGGMIGPVLLMFGLGRMPASGASLLLNAEAVFTALLAWFAFRENVDRRIAFGMLAIVAGAVVLSWPGEARFESIWPSLLVLSACLMWAIDNNLTRKISLTDATWLASVKGLVAGGVNLTLACLLGASWPSLPHVAGAMLVGLLAYGISLALFVVGLRHLGAARTGAYFSIAPFFGAVLSIPLFGDVVDARLMIAGALMALGVWLHLSEQHGHLHAHEAMDHEHEHVHDEHHQHKHEKPAPPSARHMHWHRHEPMVHTHTHFPDTHHRHGHQEAQRPCGVVLDSEAALK